MNKRNSKMNKKDLMIKLTNEFVDASLALSDGIETYLNEDVPKIEVAKKVKAASDALDRLRDYLREYKRD